jgi:hypothetical protein
VLEAAGLVEIAADDNDVWRRAVRLTGKGAQSLEAGLADWKRAHGELAMPIRSGDAMARIAISVEDRHAQRVLL